MNRTGAGSDETQVVPAGATRALDPHGWQGGAETVVADRYELHELVGRGATGTVYRATDRVLDRTVAVKLLRRDIADARVASRFASEARAAARLHHPNVVAVYDAGNHHDQPFIVMEYVKGETLATRIQRRRLSCEAVRSIGAQLCRGIAAAHAVGLIHRDIKPSNILFTRNGFVKVADFGIARTTDDTNATTAGLVVGTLAYIAPERFAGTATTASDIYSIGVVLYEALVGRPPFVAQTAAEIVTAIAAGANDVRAARPDVEPALAAIIGRALSRTPEQRFATAADMGRALDERRVRRAKQVPEPQPTERMPSVHSSTVAGDEDEPRSATQARGRKRAVVVAGLTITGLIVAAVLGLIVQPGDDPLPPAPSTTTTTTATGAPATSISPELQRAIDELRKAVEPS